MKPVPSPCVGVCRLDKAQTCEGCRRTIEEIRLWRRLSDAEKKEILDRIGSAA
jgi:predicted Fe-S protein YdhL (DUF1289 family)